MKLISESLNEFKKGLDPIYSLGLGCRAMIEEWLKKMGVVNYIINDDYTIDVNGDVDLSSRNLIEFPEYIQFANIRGGFSCDCNMLTSLKGCPKRVKGSFYAYKNNLSSLKYGPTYVNKYYSVHHNDIISLKGFPEYVGKNLRLYLNKNFKFNEDQIRKICVVDGDIELN